MARRAKISTTPRRRATDRLPRPYFPDRLCYWLFFQLLFSLVPIAAVSLRIRGAGFPGAIEHGELVLVSVVLCGGAMAAAARFSPRGRRGHYRQWLIGWSFVVCLLGIAVYSNMRDLQAPLSPSDAKNVLDQSLWFLLAGVVVGIGGVYLEHVEAVVLRGGEE